MMGLNYKESKKKLSNQISVYSQKIQETSIAAKLSEFPLSKQTFDYMIFHSLFYGFCFLFL